MMVHDLESGRREVLGPGELPFYSPSGHLLYQAGPLTYDLWALPFSLDTLRATGPAFPIARNGRQPMVASDQTLVYRDADIESQTLALLDRHGTRLAVVGQPTAGLGWPRFSADGKRAAVSAVESGNRDIFVYDLTRNIKTRLTSDPADDLHATWTRSGEEITFASGRSGNGDIFRMSADGVGGPELLVGTPLQEADHEWSSDGQFLVYNIIPPDTGHDIWYAKRKADGSLGDPVKFLQTPFSERIGALSPNGRFLAFSSDQSSQFEVYVRTFPQGRGGGQVSVNGGAQPRWSRDGKELFYVKDEALWSVPVRTEGDFAPGTPVRLFENPGLLWRGANAQYDVSANGQFLVKEYVASGAPSSISIIQNWYEEFRDRQQD
jgi:serine/threonine-protein kinase